MAKKDNYYSLSEILSHNAEYNVIYGERSNGKTTAVLRYGLERFITSGYLEQMAIVRRWEEDFKGKNGQQMFDGIIGLGWVQELTGDRYNSIWYWGQKWYLCTYDEDGKRQDTLDRPFAMAFSIGSEEHYKSTAYPDVTTILFDEFITRGYYIADEFVKFQNLLSTIIRLRDDVKIFMCGNTINRYCPYFSEMGLTNVKNQHQGSIDVYTYGESDLTVAVEYCAGFGKKKKSNKYFAFNNPKLEMITTGGWEIDIYPHLPEKYAPTERIYTFYLQFGGDTLEADIVVKGSDRFVYFHRKTTDIDPDTMRVWYHQQASPKWNHEINMLRPQSKPAMKILEYMRHKRVFYQDNEVGEIVRNYLSWCKQN